MVTQWNQNLSACQPRFGTPWFLRTSNCPTFDGRGDPMEHVIAFNTLMAVVGAADSLKCKLLVGTFSNVALRWYIILPRFSIVSYQDMIRKLPQ